MKRRNLLKSLGALGALPMLPAISIIPSAAGKVAVTTVATHEKYKWAEMIVRAHKKISPGMLERLLKVDTATASALKSQLLERGVITAQANSFGIHSAVKPLYEGAFVRPSSELANTFKQANETLDKILEEDEEQQEIESEIKDLDELAESEIELKQEPEITQETNTLS